MTPTLPPPAQCRHCNRPLNICEAGKVGCGTGRAGAAGRYDDDPVWDALFAQSQDMLKQMADDALTEYQAGEKKK